MDVYIGGCPPRPEALMHGILKLQEKIMRQAKEGRRPTPDMELVLSEGAQGAGVRRRPPGERSPASRRGDLPPPDPGQLQVAGPGLPQVWQRAGRRAGRRPLPQVLHPPARPVLAGQRQHLRRGRDPRPDHRPPRPRGSQPRRQRRRSRPAPGTPDASSGAHLPHPAAPHTLRGHRCRPEGPRARQRRRPGAPPAARRPRRRRGAPWWRRPAPPPAPEPARRSARPPGCAPWRTSGSAWSASWATSSRSWGPPWTRSP